MVALYEARPGGMIELPLAESPVPARVLGVWRDYARQFGTVVIDDADYRRLTGDERINDLALWLSADADPGAVQQALRDLLQDPSMLARRKEFGLLAHLGLTRSQVVAVVAGEGAAWVAAGTLAGLLLGLAVSMVLVFVVNPQSFHWTMDLVLPWGRLALLSAAVMLAGPATAAFSARRAAGQAAVLSVKEDW